MLPPRELCSDSIIHVRYPHCDCVQQCTLRSIGPPITFVNNLTKIIIPIARAIPDSQPLCPAMVPPPYTRPLANSMPAAGRHRGGGAYPEPGMPQGGGLAALPLHARAALSLSPGSPRARQGVSPACYSPVTRGYYAKAWGSCSPTGFRRLTLDNPRGAVYNPTHD